MRFDHNDDFAMPPNDAAAWDAYLASSPCEVWAAAYPEADAERVWAEQGECAVVDRARPDERDHDASPFDACPAKLRERPQWLLWRYNRKGNKIPVQRDGTPADTTKPKTWTSYEQACAAFRAAPRRFAGIGYVFTDDDPYTGIDLDDVLADGEIVVPRAAAIVAAMDSYTEISPSGSGLKLWVHGTIPHAVQQKMVGGWQIEMYNRVRYFTVTGRRWPGTPAGIRPADEALATLYEQVRPTGDLPPVERGPRVPVEVGDRRAQAYAEAALASEQQRMLAAQQGERHNVRLSAASRMGRFAAILGEQRIFDALFVNVGDDKRNAQRTIWDGIKYGKRKPAMLPAPRDDVRRGHGEPPPRMLLTDVPPDETTPHADPRDREIMQLRRALASSESRRVHLERWRDRTYAIIAKPNVEISATDKLTAIALAPEMEQRERLGITDLHPLFIGGACATTGMSAGTYGASLRRLAEMGVIERREEYHRDRQRTEVLIRPVAFDTPDAWTPIPRTQSASRRDRALPPPPICDACGPGKPSYTRDTTITEFICGGCGVVVGEIERVGKKRPHPRACAATTDDHAQRPFANTDDAPREADTFEASDGLTPSDEPATEAHDETEEAAAPRPRRRPTPDRQDAGPMRLWAIRMRQIVRAGRRGARRRPP